MKLSCCKDHSEPEKLWAPAVNCLLRELYPDEPKWDLKNARIETMLIYGNMLLYNFRAKIHAISV